MTSDRVMMVKREIEAISQISCFPLVRNTQNFSAPWINATELAVSATCSVVSASKRRTLERPTSCTESFITLIKRMINPDPKRRPSAEEIITEHQDARQIHEDRKWKQLRRGSKEEEHHSGIIHLKLNATRLQRTKTTFQE